MPQNKKISYNGACASLATMHYKEQAIAPHFKKFLNIDIQVAQVDTDSLGTFAGEINRMHSMIDTAICKARMGMKALESPIGIASEGSFGPHPAIPFIYAGTELIVFVDEVHDIILSESLITTQTNFATIKISKAEIPEAFLKQAKFPSHALLVKTVCNNTLMVQKGINDLNELEKAIQTFLKISDSGTIEIETDMRAHMNPTRMKCIDQLANTLAKRVAKPCPSCKIPGFGILKLEKGLICQECDSPTDEISTKILRCAQCPYQKIEPFNKKKATADPSQCGFCNP